MLFQQLNAAMRSLPSPSRPPLRPHASSDSAPALSTGDKDDGGGSDEVVHHLYLSIPSPPYPLDLRDVAVAKIPASSMVLFPPLTSKLEGDGSGTGAACTWNPSLLLFVCLLLFLLLQGDF
jgi:hypothetical protein